MPTTQTEKGHLLVDDTSPLDPDDDDLAALDFFAPDTDSAPSDLDALDEYGLDDDVPPPEPMFTVTNPPGTVTVSALMDGRVAQVELSQDATTMTEERLAEEIVVIARLATQDARAAQYTFMLEGMRHEGHDDVATRDFLTRDLGLPSLEDAAAARSHVFTTRYAGEQ